MKKIISTLLSVVLVFGSMLTISATHEISDVVQSVYDMTVTVTTDSDVGPITAYVKRIKDGAGQDVVDTNIYGIGQENAVQTDATYTYTFVFTMHETVQRGTYRIFFRDGVQGTKDYAYNRVQDIVDFYNQLDVYTTADITANADVIKNKLLAGEAAGFVTYDLTKYKSLNANIRKLVDQEISGWNLAATIPTLATVETYFETQMDEVMRRAEIANADPATFGAAATAAITATVLDGAFYEKTTPAVVASFMHPESITSISNATIKTQFSKAVLLSIANQSDYLTLYDATVYFVDNSIINLDDTKLATLIANNLHLNLFKELVKDIYTFDTVEAYETTARQLMNTLLAQIGTTQPGGTPPTQRPVGGGQGSSVGVPMSPTEPEEDDTVTFNDIETVSWAKEAITSLAARGIISGRGNGVYAPNDGVTREEMVKLVVTAIDKEDSGAACDFADVSKDRWSYPYIAAAYDLGLINGVDDVNFDPAGGITRESLAVILYRTYKQVGKDVDAERASFTDDGKISDYAKDAVDAMVTLGIMEGMGD
ncbi:MAG: S-layer homology domain-containing protein, partial [Clostridia bacterium]|nr:S-layer homology domain-containing protein [Clostridia bacterium]